MNSTSTSTTTNSTNSTQSPMTAKEFRMASYDAYLKYVAFIEGNASAEETVVALAPLFNSFGFGLNTDNLASVLTLRMTAYGSDRGERARKVKSIGIFRAFIKGGWAEVVSAPVHSNAGRMPSASAPKKSKAALEAELAELKAQLAALTPSV